MTWYTVILYTERPLNNCALRIVMVMVEIEEKLKSER